MDPAPDAALEAAAEELYGGDPDVFVARRTELSREAKAEGAAERAATIAGWRRPTRSAWAVNLAVRAEPGVRAALFDVGHRLRTAWSEGEHGRLAALTAERDEVVAELAEAAAEAARAAGLPLSDAASREVTDTLIAATTLPDVAAEVAAGRVERGREYAGFPTGTDGEWPEVPEAPARRTAKPRSRPRADDPEAAERARAEAEQRAADDAAAAREAERVLADAEKRLAEAERDRDAADERVTSLEAELDRAREDRVDALRRYATLRQERDRAARRAARPR